MANIQLSRREVEKHLKLDAKTLDAIHMFGTPAQLSDDVLEIEVFPNRPDLLSLQGFVRAMKAYLGKEKGLKTYPVKKSNCRLMVEKSLPQQWPYALACIIKGIQFDDAKIREVIDIQEKLGATLLRKRKKGGIGLYPLEKIHFPVRFVGMKPEEIMFRPLEYPEAITGRQILSKHPTGREYAKICEAWERFPVFLDSKNQLMSMPPIINSHDMGKIDETTQDVFLEVTGPELQTLEKALVIIATALADMGGTIHSIECIQQDGKKHMAPELSPQKMKLSLENVNKLLGLQLKERDIGKLLERMGYDYTKGSVKVPAWRSDVLHEVDIIEDIAIAYGYDKLIPELPPVATIAQEDAESRFARSVAETLVGLGFLELSSYHLIKETESEMLRTDDAKLELQDSKTEYKLLRPNLMIPALRVLAENKDHEYPQKLFELGTVFGKDAKKATETGIREEEHLLIALSPGNFTEMKQILEYLARSLGVSLGVQEGRHPALIDGRTADILINGKKAGTFGEVHPETLRFWNLRMPVVIAELSLDVLMKACVKRQGLRLRNPPTLVRG